jgi:hypothetical protein
MQSIFSAAFFIDQASVLLLSFSCVALLYVLIAIQQLSEPRFGEIGKITRMMEQNSNRVFTIKDGIIIQRVNEIAYSSHIYHYLINPLIS